MCLSQHIIDVDSIVEIYYKLVNFEYSINDESINLLIGEINNKCPKITTKHVYQVNKAEYNFPTSFNNLTTFNNFSYYVDSLYNVVKDTIEDNNINKQTKTKYVMDTVNDSKYPNFLKFVKQNGVSEIDIMYDEFNKVFHNVLIYENLINKEIIRCLLRQHIARLVDKQKNYKTVYMSDKQNIYELKKIIDKQIEELDKINNDIIVAQQLMSDMFTIHYYKYLLIKNETFDKLFKLNFYLC